jgi:transposase
LQNRPDPDGRPGVASDVAILRSAPGIGRGVAATLLAEGGRPLADRDLASLRAHAGIAPVTQQSGKRWVVRMRFGCNGHLRNALYHWGRIAVQREPRARAHYQTLRRRGQSHGRALRGVVDRLLAMLMAMLRTGTCYDATRRQLATPVATETLA